VIPISERQLRRVIRSYVDYYHEDRTHLGLEKGTPEERIVESRENGKVISILRVGGLHHRYSRELRTAA
jgi:hypothetical protein